MIDLLLSMSLTGSTVVLVWWVAAKLSGERLSAIWHDRILRLALFFMLVPVGRLWSWGKGTLLSLVTAPRVNVPPVASAVPENTITAVVPVVPDLSELPSQTVIGELTTVLPEAVQETSQAAVSLSLDLMQVLTVLWAVGAVLMLGYKLWCWWKFKKLLGRERQPLSGEQLQVFADCRKELGIKGVVNISVVPGIPTPLATGLLQPTILLPDTPLTQEELRCVLLHELTHVKRQDLWVRFFSLAGVVVHWYDPVMHLLNHQIKQRSEQSCDEQVARSMTGAERMAYGGMILKMVTDTTLGPAEWAVTLSTRESVQQRLRRVIQAGKWTRMDKAVALVVSVGILLCTAVAVWAMAGPIVEAKAETVPEQGKPAQEEPDTSTGYQSPVATGTIEIGGVVYETYEDNRGILRLAESVGTGKYMDAYDLLLVSELENGKYPVNGRGETYGWLQLADFAGAEPDLIATTYGYDASGAQIFGYVWWEDYYADFDDPPEGTNYEPVSGGANLIPEATYGAQKWKVPLYDENHQQIGWYDAWPDVYRDKCRLIRSLEASAAAQEDEGEPNGTLSNHG